MKADATRYQIPIQRATHQLRVSKPLVSSPRLWVNLSHASPIMGRRQRQPPSESRARSFSNYPCPPFDYLRCIDMSLKVGGSDCPLPLKIPVNFIFAHELEGMKERKGRWDRRNKLRIAGRNMYTIPKSQPGGPTNTNRKIDQRHCQHTKIICFSLLRCPPTMGQDESLSCVNG